MFMTRRCAVAGSCIFSFLVCGHLLAGEKVRSPAPESRAAVLVRLALEHEVAGDEVGRDRLLKEAAIIDPAYLPAHWHLGEVWNGEKWLQASTARGTLAHGPDEVEYETKRSEAAGSATLELKLAQWCLKQKMSDRAQLHFWRVLIHPKANDEQIKDVARQLDLVSVGGTILTRADLKQEQLREKRIAEAIGKYRPILAQLQPAIDGGFDKKHDEAVQKLSSIDDPAVIPAVETFLSGHKEGFGEELVKLLVKFPQLESTQTLVRYAVASPFLGVRERATDELQERPLHDYVPTLLAGLVSPIQSQFRFAIDRKGTVAYQQVFRQDAAHATFDVRQYVELHPVPFGALSGGPPSGSVRNRSTNVNASSITVSPHLALMELSLVFEGQRLQANAVNLAADQANKRVYQVLEETTGQQLPRNPNEWWDWWKDYNQLHYPKPTYWRSVGRQSSYAQSYGHQHIVPKWYRGPWANALPGRPFSCFRAGTPVWTETGLRPIESIQAGDRVLSQDPDSGELTFKLVINTTVRPPAEASQLDILGETIATTLGHPLWVTGQGWEMAKHVKPGDQLHGVHGILVASAIDPLPNKIEAHNLVVEDFGTYFVGNCGLLVHDNTYRKPTRAVVPGLVP